MNHQLHHHPGVRTRGFTLLETLVTIGLVTVLFSVYTIIISNLTFLRRTQYDVQVANLIQEELEVLQGLPYTDLINRTGGNFLGIPIQRGNWQVQSIASTNTIQNTDTVLAVIEETGLLLLPGNYREDFTLISDVRIDSSSVSGWGGGMVFRYRDAENHYRFRISSGGIALDRILQGVKSTIWSQSETYNTDQWYELEVIASGDSFTLKRDTVTLTTQSDASFTTGDLGLIALNAADTAFDDVSVTESGTTSWDFEADTVGELPAPWVRRSYADLPTGAGVLTISDYLSDADIKEVTATITWKDGPYTRSKSGTTLIAN